MSLSPIPLTLRQVAMLMWCLHVVILYTLPTVASSPLNRKLLNMVRPSPASVDLPC